MKENDIEEIIQWYNNFINIVKQLSMSAEEQIQQLKGTVVTDELALDFSEIGIPYAQKLLSYGWITQDQFKLVRDIEEKLGQMTQKKELWNDNALINSTDWDSCRKSGMDLLQTLEKHNETF